MSKIIIGLLILILVAPVAGSTYHCATKNEAIITHSEYDVARFIDKKGAFCRNVDEDEEEVKYIINDSAIRKNCSDTGSGQICHYWVEVSVEKLGSKK